MSNWILDVITDGVIILDKKGLIAELNPASQKIVGRSSQEALGCPIEHVLHSATGLIDLYHNKGEVRTEFASDSNPGQYYEAYASPPLDDNSQNIGRVIILRDITEQKQTENALRESEQKHRSFTESLPETVWETDLTGQLIYGNTAGLEKFGYTQEELAAGINIFSCIAPESRETALDNFKKMVLGSPPTGTEYTGIRRDGSRFPIVISATPVIRNGVPVGLTGVLVDLSARRQIEDLELEKQRTSAMLEGYERLSRDVAEILHGRVQNKLLLALHKLDAYVRSLSDNDSPAPEPLSEIQNIIEDVREKEIRNASHRLHPSIIDVGLISAIRSLTDTFEEFFSVEMEIDEKLTALDDVIENRIPATVRLAVYRILEETLNNAYRHGETNRVKISMGLDAQGQLAISARDDGCGFNTDEAGQGLGLKTIAGRAQSVGGTAQVKSTPGQGTEVEVSIPI